MGLCTRKVWQGLVMLDTVCATCATPLAGFQALPVDQVQRSRSCTSPVYLNKVLSESNMAQGVLGTTRARQRVGGFMGVLRCPVLFGMSQKWHGFSIASLASMPSVKWLMLHFAQIWQEAGALLFLVKAAVGAGTDMLGLVLAWRLGENCLARQVDATGEIVPIRVPSFVHPICLRVVLECFQMQSPLHR